mmetsp:Transcript_22221/g.69602  ORF Transcript_22221/g.69602 Transcript_22221/m.69602 type:complete len:130 (+) Transcript_22221:389-778(+)
MSTTSKNETAPLLGKGGGTSNRASATGAPKFLVGLLAGLAIGALLGAKAGQHQARTEPTGLVTGDDCSKAKEGWSEFRRYTKNFKTPLLAILLLMMVMLSSPAPVNSILVVMMEVCVWRTRTHRMCTLQ